MYYTTSLPQSLQHQPTSFNPAYKGSMFLQHHTVSKWRNFLLLYISFMPLFMPLCFNAPCQFTPFLNFHSHIFGLTSFAWFIWACVFFSFLCEGNFLVMPFLFMSTSSGVQLEHKTMAGCYSVECVLVLCLEGGCGLCVCFHLHGAAGMIYSVLTRYLPLSHNSCLKKQSN